MKDQYQHYLELLKGLRLMDDDFFSEALDEKIGETKLSEMVSRQAAFLPRT